MNVDDRGRRAAEALHRSVDGHVDVELALQAASVTATPARRLRSIGWARVALPAAVVLVAVTLLGLAALKSPSGRLGVQRDDALERKIEALPAGPLDGKESLRLPLVAEPQHDLRDGQVIVIGGRGFVPGEQVGAVMCSSEADTGDAGVDACDLGEGFANVTSGTASPEGIVRISVAVRRYIQTPKYGRVDCLSAAERCLVAVGANSDYDRSGGSYVNFAGAPPFPTPSAAVAPSTNLRPGQEVRVSGTGLLAGRQYQVQQCAGSRCVARAIVKVTGYGTVDLALAVYPAVRDDEGTVECADRCTVRITGNGPPVGASSAPMPDAVPIRFDPAAPAVPVPPPTTVPPPSTTASTVPPDRGVPCPPEPDPSCFPRGTVMPSTTSRSGTTAPSPTTTAPPTQSTATLPSSTTTAP